jgi:hypothetical protein
VIIVDLDECQIDKSGTFLLVKANVDKVYGEDNVVINVNTNETFILNDTKGAAGHSDNGWGFMVAGK